MDHLHDTNQLLISGIELPEFIKVAEEKPKFFAYTDGIQSFFPIDNPSNTYLSALYFEKNAHVLKENDYKEVHDKILDALNMYGVEYSSPFNNVEKTANENEYTFEKLASEIKVFEQNYKHITPKERHDKAKEIFQRYETLKESGSESTKTLPKIVEEYAGEHLREDWPNIVNYRASKVNDQEGKEAYHSLSKLNETKDVILALLERLDKRFGIDNYYEKGIKDPYRALLSLNPPKPKKTIVMIIDGNEYDIEKVASFDPSVLSDRFTDEVISSLKADRNNYLQTAPDFVKLAVAEAIDAGTR